MVFSSFVFLFAFLPVVLLLYFVTPDRAKNAVLLIFSLLFYAWGEPVWIVVLLLNAAVGWGCGLWIERCRGRKKAAAVLFGSAAFQIALLVYFKYTGLLLHTLQAAIGVALPFREPGLPIGISFFTFHLISYLTDVYRGEARALKSYSQLLLYLSLFPQLVAGPIVRFADVHRQLERRRVTLEDFARGISRFVIGLGKKVVFADSLAGLAAVYLEGDPGKLSVAGAWFGIVLFALQIYFDFSGYSDMAIGLGRMFGFAFKENFDYPYVSRSATEFWRRWNISVGRFFRDYVYIPLGGNRRRPWFNLFAVWALTGLWHGASWNYVAWGLYFGLLIAIEKSFFSRLLEAAPSLFSHLYFAIAVLTGWVLFYFEAIGRGLLYLRTMYGFGAAPLTDAELAIRLQNNVFLLLAAIVAATPLPAAIHRALAERLRPGAVRGLYTNALVPVVCLAILAVSVLLLVGKTYSPFFYFRF
ncbi:MBOAT family O-acyltransferase [Paenibacillus flagellatus]|uniref:Membrane-bound O-acyltransferase family protein n=1 Tax=Paenibacillus flagellatus TaxID=2211139 RepID=A0A2V5K5G1_9BACL|nr:MBOAT family O-acyltransferase [Paenibacillus flagellatus]PYI54625.1 membrane-bound O-acyltransferase family protein [Paenibacillus flagellatus]